MRSDLLVEGEYYALKVGGDECVRVRLTSLEARYTSKVIVNPPHSAEAGAGMEVPIALVVSTWDEYLAQHVEFQDTLAFHNVLWIPEPGEVVELKGTGALEWTVDSVSFSEGGGWIKIRSEVFGGEQIRRVALTELRRLRQEVASSVAHEANFADEEHSRWDLDESGEHDRVEPVRDLRPETIADRLVFSESARVVFRGMSWCKPGKEEGRMRSEVRRWGYIGKTRRRRGFIRYIVGGRFEFVLDEDPMRVEGDIWVDEIVDVRSAKAKAKFAKERKARSRRRGVSKKRPSDSKAEQRHRRRRRNRHRPPAS